MATTKKAVKKTPAKKKAVKKKVASKLVIQTAEMIAEAEEKIASKWDTIFKKKLGQLVLFKTVRDKKQKVYGWAAEDGFFLRGMKYRNEIFVENLGWPDMEMANNNNDDPGEEAKRKFKKPQFGTDAELWIYKATDCLVYPHNAANEKVAQKFNSLLGDDLDLQNHHIDLVEKYGEKHQKVEDNLDLIDNLQAKIIDTLRSLKK